MAERNKERTGYVNRIRMSARVAQATGFLLPQDAAVSVNSAAVSLLFNQPATADPPR